MVYIVEIYDITYDHKIFEVLDSRYIYGVYSTKRKALVAIDSYKADDCYTSVREVDVKDLSESVCVRQIICENKYVETTLSFSIHEMEVE